MTPDGIFTEFEKAFQTRKFVAGLLVAFIDFYLELDTPVRGFKSLQDLFVAYPRALTTAQGKQANTLIVELPKGKKLSLRSYYNGVEKLFRAEHKRFDYPSCAPHATQAWQDYIAWLDGLTGLTLVELNDLRTRVVDFVLDTLPSQAFDPASVSREPPLFRMILEFFDLTAHKGEPTGASYQGIIFGFLRADNPHLQLEISSVRTGSKRLQRIGDIDAWDGARLAISAEVKQYLLNADDIAKLQNFANDVTKRGSLGIVAALQFADGVRTTIEELELRALSIDDLIRIVDLWDPLKQRVAVSSLNYYFRHVEKNSSLFKRLEKFLEKAGKAYAVGEKLS
jgi:hypothetical protein